MQKIMFHSGFELGPLMLNPVALSIAPRALVGNNSAYFVYIYTLSIAPRALVGNNSAYFVYIILLLTVANVSRRIQLQEDLITK